MDYGSTLSGMCSHNVGGTLNSKAFGVCSLNLSSSDLSPDIELPSSRDRFGGPIKNTLGLYMDYIGMKGNKTAQAFFRRTLVLPTSNT